MKKRTLSILLTVAVLLTCFAYTAPVNAASKADMKKANVKWDLKNNKTIKFKTTWSVLGKKTHTVKMTKFKIKNSKKKGYKECTFTLTVNRKIKPTSRQVMGMVDLVHYSETKKYDNGPFGGGFWFSVIDYKTGKCLEAKNKQKVTVTSSGWKHTNEEKKYGVDGFYIWYAKKSTVNVKIVYPKNYKNLCIGIGGYTDAVNGYCAGNSCGYKGDFVLTKWWGGKKAFSKETKLYSKKDKNFAHFMRVK